jgi:hypothetical protein
MRGLAGMAIGMIQRGAMEGRNVPGTPSIDQLPR